MFRRKRNDSWSNEPKKKHVDVLHGIDPKDLVALAELCEKGELPFDLKQATKFCVKSCRGASMLPAFKIGRGWFTTRRAVRIWLFSSANKAMQEFAMDQAEQMGELSNKDCSLPGPNPFERHRRYSLKTFCDSPMLPIPYETAKRYTLGKLKPKLRGQRVGRHWMVSRADIARWIAECRNTAVGHATEHEEIDFEFGPLGLIKIKELCAKGMIPISYVSAVKFCLSTRHKGFERPSFPAWKIAGEWWTTEKMLGLWFVRLGNDKAKAWNSNGRFL